MDIKSIPSEVDIHSYEGLTRLFRFGISHRKSKEDRSTLERIERRFGLAKYDPSVRGALEDTVRYLDNLAVNERFEKVFDLIAGASDQKIWLDRDLADNLVQISRAEEIVRFSFAPAISACLLHAQAAQKAKPNSFAVYATRYAGVGADVPLIAFAALFLRLPIHAEINPPWDPDSMLDEDEPNTEPPNLEITLPPSEFRIEDAPHLENSVRKSQLPRAVDRGKCDLESVMLGYLSRTQSSALAFVSESFVSSTKQSRLLTRRHLLEATRINRVSELTTTTPHQVLIELQPTNGFDEHIKMETAHTIERFIGIHRSVKQLRGTSGVISIEEIHSAGDTLAPTRFLSKGPVGGRGLSAHFTNLRTPTKFRLADLFEIIRPKTTRDDPVGDFRIQEVRAGDITPNGEISGASRKISIRETLEIGLADQVIKSGDVLFAHRGPIGRVAYVRDTDVQDFECWAAQSLLIFRPRNQTSGKGTRPYCDPRVLFMYLLTTAVRDSWAKLAIGDRSPAIPIGEVERFGLPENLLLQKKPRKTPASSDITTTNSHSDLILTDFKARQSSLMKMREIETSMKDGLERVWDTAWTKMLK